MMKNNTSKPGDIVLTRRKSSNKSSQKMEIENKFYVFMKNRSKIKIIMIQPQTYLTIADNTEPKN
jgi:hypothetical protein